MAIAEKHKENVSLDEILAKFHVFGWYHGRLLLLLLLIAMFMKSNSLNYIFVAEIVSYRCNDDKNGSIIIDCSHQCSEWVYDNPDSLVAEFDLACQDWKRTLIGTVHNMGHMFGILIVGAVSDGLGRKTALILTAVASGVVGLAKSFAPYYWLYIAMEFLEAFIGIASSPFFMMAVEAVAKEKRVVFVSMCAMGHPLGGMYFAMLAWLFPHWRSMARVIYGPPILFILYQFLLDDSPRWLIASGKKEDAIKVIQKAAGMNKLTIDKKVLANLTVEERQKVNYVLLLKDTFASLKLTKRLLICAVWWTSSVLINVGMTINSVSLQGNRYANFAILFAIEIPGLFMNLYILKRFKRKTVLIVYFFIGAVLCLTQPFMPRQLTWLSITLYMVGRLISVFFSELTNLYTSELFPTYTRNSMHSLCASIGGIGALLAPQTPLLMAYWSGLPALLFGCCALISGTLTFFVPDTRDDSLPDTVRQAEDIGHKSNKQMETNHRDDVEKPHRTAVASDNGNKKECTRI